MLCGFLYRLAMEPKSLTLTEPMLLTRNEMRMVEKLWFEEEIPACNDLETLDIQTCWNTELLNDNVIFAFIRAVAINTKGL